MRDHHINVFYSDEDGGYIADIPDLEACAGFGLTPRGGLGRILRATKAWIEAARDRAIDIPPPRYRPALYA